MFKSNKISLIIHFKIVNPSNDVLNYLRYFIEKINKFEYISLDYKLSEYKNFHEEQSVNYTINTRDGILKKLNTIKNDVSELK